MVEEESDAAAIFGGDKLERPEESRWPLWSGYILSAFHELRDDRHYGAMGGLGRIYFTAISAYAERFQIAGAAFDEFLIFIRAIDDEYVAVQNERAKAEMEKSKTT